MTEQINFDAEAFGHFHRTGKIIVNGYFAQGDKTNVSISFVQDEEALHIYLSPSRARLFALAIEEAARECGRSD